MPGLEGSAGPNGESHKFKKKNSITNMKSLSKHATYFTFIRRIKLKCSSCILIYIFDSCGRSNKLFPTPIFCLHVAISGIGEIYDMIRQVMRS